MNLFPLQTRPQTTERVRYFRTKKTGDTMSPVFSTSQLKVPERSDLDISHIINLIGQSLNTFAMCDGDIGTMKKLMLFKPV